MRTRNRAALADSTVEEVEKVVEVQTKTKTPKKQKNEDLVANILSSIKKENAPQKVVEVSKSSEPIVVKSVQKKVGPKAVRGLPKSGRPWKEAKQRFSTIKKSLHRHSFEKKQKLREEFKHIKELSKSIREDKRLENIEKKQRREENARKRLENERKNEIVQVIKNPAKLKRMKKKQLRKIEKRDLTAGNGPKVV